MAHSTCQCLWFIPLPSRSLQPQGSGRGLSRCNRRLCRLQPPASVLIGTSDQYVHWLLCRKKGGHANAVRLGGLCEHVCFRRRGMQLVIMLQAWWLLPNTARRFTTGCRHWGLNTMLKLSTPAPNHNREPSSPASHDFPSSVYLPHLALSWHTSVLPREHHCQLHLLAKWEMKVSFP